MVRFSGILTIPETTKPAPASFYVNAELNKIIWQNAGVELSEADRLIFIGYSLPSADFEMRQLLSRMIKRNVKIEIVTYEENQNEQNENKIKEHWEAFFGKREIKIHLCGARHFIDKLL
ncbi:hypothetical protein [Pectobacterium brasiliense]|uniref:hypothetical protein n=1 Tax=Pectobacterium brasiliense TaxID=180957 RepID=UPI0032EE52C5